MSQDTNTELLELASEHLSYWEGKGIGEAITADIQRGDLEALREHLKESAKLIFEFEYNPNEVLADDTY